MLPIYSSSLALFNKYVSVPYIHPFSLVAFSLFILASLVTDRVIEQWPPSLLIQPDARFFFKSNIQLCGKGIARHWCPASLSPVACSSTNLAGWLNQLQFPLLLLRKFDQSPFPLSSRALLRYCSWLQVLHSAFACLMGLCKKQTVSVPVCVLASRWMAGGPS